MKFCPRCGTPVKGEEKFCTKCGYPLTGQAANVDSSKVSGNDSLNQHAQAQQQARTNQNWQQATQTLNKAENYSSNYFDWLLNTIKHPANLNSRVHPYFGLTSFIISIILSFGTFFMIIRGSMSAIKKTARLFAMMTDNYSNYDSGSQGAAEKMMVAIWSYCADLFNDLKALSSIKALVLLILFTLAFILVGFGVRKFLIDGHDNVFHYTNQLASLTNYALVFEVVAFVIALFEKGSYHTGSVMFILFMFGLTGLAYLIGFIRTVYSNKRGGFDPCYLIILSVIVLMIVNYVIIKIIL